MKSSIQTTLGIGLLLSLLSVFFVLWLQVNNAIRVVATQYIETRLQHDAESLLAATTQSTNNAWLIDSSKLSVNYNRPFSGYYYKIHVESENLLSRSLWDSDISFSDTPIADTASVFLDGPQNQRLLVFERTYTKMGHLIHILVAEDFTPIENDINDLQINLGIIAIILLLLLILLQMGLLKISLRPLKKASNELLLLERGEIKQLSVEVPKEINPMVNEINRLFSAMTLRLKRSRNAIGDLSHSLKKPLTVLQQIMLDRDQWQEPESSSIIETQISCINNIVTRTLKRARLAGDGPGGTNFILSKDVMGLIDTIGMMYRDISLNIDNRSGSSNDVLPYDRDDILELLGNIIDNAAKWANHSVCVTIKTDNKVHFIIEDDGPGISQQKVDDVIRRGVRLDESLEGQGMGLAIAYDIVEEYSGNLRFAQSEQFHGLKVDIELPL